MAIRFTDKPPGGSPRKPVKDAAREETVAEGEARFATPIEAAQPVNPAAGGELPFSDLPRAEKAERKKRAPKAAPKG